jgi:hypothetical protein
VEVVGVESRWFNCGGDVDRMEGELSALAESSGDDALNEVLESGDWRA